MAIAFVGSASANAANGGDPTITLPGGMSEDDLVVAAYTISSNTGTNRDMQTISSGWTEEADLFSNDTVEINLGVYRKFMGATPDSSVQFEGHGNTQNGVSAVAMVFSGVDTTTPFDVAIATATGVNGYDADPPSVNHNNPSGVWTICIGGSSHDGSVSSYTFPTGYTTNAISAVQAETQDSAVGMGYNTSPSDPENPGAMTGLSGTSSFYSWAAASIALRPGSGITNQSVSCNLAATVSATLAAQKPVSAALDATVSIAIVASLALSALLSATASAAKSLVFGKVVSAAVGMTVSLSKVATYVIAAVAQMALTVSRTMVVARTVSAAAMALTVSLTNIISYTVSATVTLVPTMAKIAALSVSALATAVVQRVSRFAHRRQIETAYTEQSEQSGTWSTALEDDTDVAEQSEDATAWSDQPEQVDGFVEQDQEVSYEP